MACLTPAFKIWQRLEVLTLRAHILVHVRQAQMKTASGLAHDCAVALRSDSTQEVLKQIAGNQASSNVGMRCIKQAINT